MDTEIKKTILYVDDDASVLTPYSQLLSLQGYAVVAMQSSTEALDAFTREPASFDLVIADHSMPQLNGYDMAQQFLKIRPDIPIILYTGYSAGISPAMIIQSGIREFLMKPVSSKELADVISRIFALGGGERV